MPRQRIFRRRPQRMVWTAFLAVFFLVAHSLDVCAAHSGIPDLSSKPVSALVMHNGIACNAASGVACPCAHCACEPTPIDSHSPHADGCSSTSELSTPAQNFGIQLSAPIIIAPPFAAFPDALDAPLLSVFLVGDGPPLARLRSQFLLSPLPGRAPPISV